MYFLLSSKERHLPFSVQQSARGIEQKETKIKKRVKMRQEAFEGGNHRKPASSLLFSSLLFSALLLCNNIFCNNKLFKASKVLLPEPRENIKGGETELVESQLLVL